MSALIRNCQFPSRCSVHHSALTTTVRQGCYGNRNASHCRIVPGIRLLHRRVCTCSTRYPAGDSGKVCKGRSRVAVWCVIRQDLAGVFVPRWTRTDLHAPRIGTMLKNNAIVPKQRGLIRAGGRSSSKASKHCSLDRLLMIFVLRHFREKIPEEIRSKAAFQVESFMHSISLRAATE